MSDSSFTHERALATAAATDCRIRYPAPNELFVDIDSDADFEVFEKHLAILKTHVTVDATEITPSRSGLPCRHVVVRLERPVSGPLERLLLQSVLGSDRLHELLSWLAVTKGTTPYPTVFFEPKTAAEMAMEIF